ncbi:MAG: cytochrome c [Nitrospirae bacterium]|nr:MAG: cytochrome c [Nitrospirota bacterium]
MTATNRQKARLGFVLMLVMAAGCAALTAAPPGDTPADRGKVVFEQRCLPCHGAQVKGDGYPFLKPPPADLTAFAARNRTDAELLVTIRHGHPDTAMGSWRFALTERETGDVLAYVRTLQK